MYHSDSQVPRLPDQTRYFYTSHIFPPVVSQAALTGNTSLCNLPWQGENVSIKQRLLRQTGSVLDNLSGWAVPLCTALPSFHLTLCVFFIYIYFFFFYSISPPPTRIFLLPDQYFCFSQMYCTVYLKLLVRSRKKKKRWPFHPAVRVKGCISDNVSKDWCAPLQFLLFTHTHCLPFLSPNLLCHLFVSLQMHSARPCRWMSGIFFRRPDTTSQVNRRAQTDTYPSPSFIYTGADECRLLSGFNLVSRFSLLKTTNAKKIRNPRGLPILRLGKTALLRPIE